MDPLTTTGTAVAQPLGTVNPETPLSPLAAARAPGAIAPNPGNLIQNPHPGLGSVVPPSMRLNRNPQLPAHPLNANTDSTYESQNAVLQADIQRRYADVLKQLGYMDPGSGGFIPGSVETQANQQRSELERSRQLAVEGTTHTAQEQGTLFSGLRGTEQARAEHPFVSSLADLDVSVPQQLSDLYLQGSDLIDEYTNQNNLLLADAARRRAADITANPIIPPGTSPTTPPTKPTDPLPDPTPTDPNTPKPPAPPPPDVRGIGGLIGRSIGV